MVSRCFCHELGDRLPGVAVEASKLLLLFGVTSTWGSLPAADGLGRAWLESGLLNGAGAVSSSGSPREGVSLRLAGLRKACCSTCTDTTVAQQEAAYLSHVGHESILVTDVGDVHLGEVLQAQPGQVSPAQERASALAVPLDYVTYRRSID